MRVLCDFLHRYLAPFLGGASMAATTVVSDMPSMAGTVTMAVVFGFISLPVGGRILRRVAGLDEAV